MLEDKIKNINQFIIQYHLLLRGFRAGGGSVGLIDKTQPDLLGLISADTYPNFNKYSDPISPPLGVGRFIAGNGSPLGSFLKYSWGDLQLEQIMFLSDLPTTERNPNNVNAYS